MQLKKTVKKIIFPPVILMTVLAVISVIFLIYVFVNRLEQTAFAYFIYVLAFYSLTVISVYFAVIFPKKYKTLKQKIYDHPLGNKYMTDAVFRTHISLYFSLSVNLLYVGVNILFCILYRSMWFVVLSWYYIVLAIMRFLLVRYVRKIGIGNDRLGELKRSKLCSWVLLTVNFVLSGAVLMILYQDKGFNYNGILIYIMALYTFYITVHAIIDVVKYRKYNSPVMTAAKIISLSAALVSMLSLETAMLSQFGQNMVPHNRWLMIVLTGAGVSILIVTMSVFMIVKTTKEIKKLKGAKG